MKEKGIHLREKEIYLFCGTGWRVAEVYLYLKQIGIPHIYIFNGWFEWYSLNLPCDIRIDNNKI
jgi:3-mercaptopyruvate sulfurtransferase SseA